LGISFLGTGTIFRRADSSNVRGLTTAAALLFSGAIGIAVSLRQFWVAGCCTLLVTAVLRLVGGVERQLEHRR
jgi:uncharacterized membrane protein YhiD involved in acid resistance